MANRAKTRYKVSKAAFQTGLSLTDVQEITWDGGNFVVRHSDIETPNTPINGVTRIQESYTIIPWEDIRIAYFSSVTPNTFRRLSIEMDLTDIYFNLNLEE